MLGTIPHKRTQSIFFFFTFAFLHFGGFKHYLNLNKLHGVTRKKNVIVVIVYVLHIILINIIIYNMNETL